MEIIAIDIGDRRIGVARGSSEARLPQPLDVIDRKLVDTFEKLADLLKSYNPQLIVAGLPKNLQGESTEQTKAVYRFCQDLSRRLNCLISFVDETLSTVEAETLRRRFPKAAPDSLAACIILSRYFEFGAVNE